MGRSPVQARASRQVLPERRLTLAVRTGIGDYLAWNCSSFSVDIVVHPGGQHPTPPRAIATALAFAGPENPTHLEVLLRSLDVTHLVLTGIATSGVVLSTLREAADEDYRLTVLADGCLDADAEVHRAHIDKVFPRQAKVVSVDEWASRLSGG
jgi:hypothetical protein